jgi:predicted ATP-grasp superfamily ATP-dependent carboligase
MTLWRDPPAIVFGGQAIAIPVVRSLAAAGVKAYAAGADPAYDCVAYSRHCSGYADLGNGDGWVERCLDWLAEEGPAQQAVLLPCSDEGLELVVRHRERLDELGYVPVEAKDEVVAAMLNKQRTYELAQQLGVPVPRTWVPSDADLLDPDPESEGIDFPCALKPLHSHLFAQRFGAANKLLVATNRHDMRVGLVQQDPPVPNPLRARLLRRQRLG